LLVPELFEDLAVTLFFDTDFFPGAFFVVAFFLAPVLLPWLLRALVLATFLLLRLRLFAGDVCVALSGVVLLIVIRGGSVECNLRRHHSQNGLQIQPA
jgi:hypothetical protein